MRVTLLAFTAGLTAEASSLGPRVGQSPPARPTSNAVTTVTTSAPLQPTTILTVTTTAHAAKRDRPHPNAGQARAPAYVPVCSGSDMNTFAYQQICDNSFLLPINGDSCQKWCDCDDEGKMTCKSPVLGCPDTDIITGECTNKTPTHTCKCQKGGNVPRDPGSSGVGAAEPIAQLAKQGAAAWSMSKLCHGPNMGKQGFAGYCMDGNFLNWSGKDCDTHCKCEDSGKLVCDHPSDCGPDSDVNSYCTKNDMFQCDCMAPSQVRNIHDMKRNYEAVPVVPECVAPGSCPLRHPPIEAQDTLSNDVKDGYVAAIHPCWASGTCGHDQNLPAETREIDDTSKLQLAMQRYCHAACSCKGNEETVCHGFQDDNTNLCGGNKTIFYFCAKDPHPEFSCECRKNKLVSDILKRGVSLPAELDDEPLQSRQIGGSGPPAKSHDHALVCDGSKVTTQYCKEPMRGYYCDKLGSVNHIGEFGEYSDCEDICTCVKINPKPICIFGATAAKNGVSTCLKMRADGSQVEMEYKVAGIEEMERRGEVIVLRRDETHDSQGHAKRETVPTTLWTVNVAEPSTVTLKRRYSDNYIFDCVGSGMLKSMSINKCANPSINIYLNGYYCKAHCGCDDNGCITCISDGQPEGIDQCGGDTAATGFCDDQTKPEFGCGCLNKQTDLPSTCHQKKREAISPPSSSPHLLERRDIKMLRQRYAFDAPNWQAVR